MITDAQPIYPGIPDTGHHFIYSLGSGFATGFAGSSIYNFFGGLRRGGGRGRLAGAARAISASAPRAGGTMAAYFGLFSAVDNAMCLARPNKEDLWNSLAAGAVSWAALGVRRGAPGAALVALEVALDFVDGRIPEKPRHQQPLPLLHAPTTPADTGFLGIPQGPPIVVEQVSVVGHQGL